MEQTPIENIISAIETEYAFNKYLSTKRIIEICKKRLEMEKEHLVESFDDGFGAALTSKPIALSGEQYYNNKYKQ